MTHETFAPGRVELLGNHTDYNGGVVLSAALHLGVTVRGRLREDGHIVLTSKEVEGRIEVEAGRQVIPNATWADYPLGVWLKLQEAGYPVGGFEAEYHSTVPVGSGLSSSAAMEVGTACLLQKLFGFELEPMVLAKLCRRAENEFVGVNCGLLDMVSSVFGRAGQVILLDNRNETVECLRLPPEAVFVIVHSGVKHALTGGEYNERREQCLEAARLLGISQLRDASTAMLDQAGLPDLIARRARHITGENERVGRAVGALNMGDLTLLGELFLESHESSKINFENSTPELDLLVEIAAATPGIYGARLSGGGFGGVIVALADRARAVHAAASIEAVYRARSGHVGHSYVCEAGDGAAVANASA